MKYNTIKEAYERFGYTFYTKPYSINIFGVRDTSETVDEFNDLVCIVYVNDKGQEIVDVYQGTTKAGSSVLNEKMGNKKGTAILPSQGQWFEGWKIGKHQNKYEALVQNKKIDVIRDNDMDGKHSYDSEVSDYGFHGINIHRANRYSLASKVGNHSWGCVVVRRYGDWQKFWKTVKRSSKQYGNTFTFSMFDNALFDNNLISKLK